MIEGGGLDVAAINATRPKGASQLSLSFGSQAVYDAPGSIVGVDGFSDIMYAGSPNTFSYIIARWIKGLRLALPVYVPVYVNNVQYKHDGL